MVSDFKQLKVWQKAVDFSAAIYKLTNKFPKSEIYGLTSQLRRAVVSVSCNIAEGCGKKSSIDFVRYLHNAYGSIKEVESCLILAQKLGYLTKPQHTTADISCREVSKMLFGLIKAIEKS